MSFLDIVLLLLFHLAIGHVPKMCMVQEGYIAIMVPPTALYITPMHALLCGRAMDAIVPLLVSSRIFLFSPLLPFSAVSPPFPHKHL